VEAGAADSSGVRCPRCGNVPGPDARWECDACEEPFDLFAARAACPRCARTWLETWCDACARWSPHWDWYRDVEQRESFLRLFPREAAGASGAPTPSPAALVPVWRACARMAATDVGALLRGEARWIVEDERAPAEGPSLRELRSAVLLQEEALARALADGATSSPLSALGSGSPGASWARPGRSASRPSTAGRRWRAGTPSSPGSTWPEVGRARASALRHAPRASTPTTRRGSWGARSPASPGWTSTGPSSTSPGPSPGRLRTATSTTPGACAVGFASPSATPPARGTTSGAPSSSPRTRKSASTRRCGWSRWASTARP